MTGAWTRERVAMLLLLGLASVVAADAGGFGDRDAVILFAGSGTVLFGVSLLRPDESWRAMISPPVLLLFSLAALGALSLVWTSADLGDALTSLMLPAAYAAVAASAAALSPSPGARALVLPWIAGFSLLAGLSGLTGVLFKDESWGTLLDGHWLAAGFVEYPPALAFLLIAGLPAWGLISLRSRGAARVAALSALGILGLCLALTGSRLGIAIAAALLILFTWHRRRDLSRWAAFLIAVAVLAAAAASVTLAGTGSGDGEGRQRVQGADHGRLALWEDSLPAIGEEPVTGHGAASYFEATREDQEDPTLFAHSLPVESGVELGLPGAALAIGLILSCWLACLRRRGTASAWIFGPAVVAFTLFGLTDWIWHLAGVGAVWAVLLGSLLGAPVARSERPAA